MIRLSGKCLVFLAAVALSSSAYAQVGKQIIKSGSRALGSGVAEKSVLNTMSQWYKAGAAVRGASAAAASVDRAVKSQVLSKTSREHALRNSGFFNPIVPTPSSQLHINLIHPTTEQVNQAVNEYNQLMIDLIPVRREVNTKLLYQTLPNDKWSSLSPQDRRYLIAKLSALQPRVEKLRRVVFSKDPALKQAEEWLNQAMQEINPFYVPGLSSNTRTDTRVFAENEFFLRDPGMAAWGQKKELPKNVRVAVLNDQTEILDMYRLWEREKRLGEGWSVAAYTDTRELLKDMQSGATYDLIITDLTVPGGGGYYLADQVRAMGRNTPIIGCSMYTIDKINAEQMFEQGFDGYIYGDDMFEEAAGSVKWIGYIKNYYYYKGLHGWSR